MCLPDLDREITKEDQLIAERTRYEDIEIYLRSGSYRKGMSLAEKRAIRRACGRTFTLKGDTLLYRSTSSKDSLTLEDSDDESRRAWRRVIKYAEEREEIIRHCHTEPTGGHFGRDKTLEKVQSRFFWKVGSFLRSIRIGFYHFCES